MGAAVVTTPYGRGGQSEVLSAVSGDLHLVPLTFAFSTSYATGGDTITAAQLPKFKDLITPWAIPSSPFGFSIFLDVANLKIKAFAGAGAAAAGAEVTAGTNLSSICGVMTVLFAARQ